jgi:hypothetical protein
VLIVGREGRSHPVMTLRHTQKRRGTEHKIIRSLDHGVDQSAIVSSVFVLQGVGQPAQRRGRFDDSPADVGKVGIIV